MLWRSTLVITAARLFAQYGLRVFAPNNFLLDVKSKQRNSALCYSGLISCEDDEQLNVAFSNHEYNNFKLYLPYCILLIAFILGHFILTSENYQNLMEDVIEKEARMREARRGRDGDDSAQYVHTPEISLDQDPAEQSNLMDGMRSPNNANEGEDLVQEERRQSVGNKAE